MGYDYSILNKQIDVNKKPPKWLYEVSPADNTELSKNVKFLGEFYQSYAIKKLNVDAVYNEGICFGLVCCWLQYCFDNQLNDFLLSIYGKLKGYNPFANKMAKMMNRQQYYYMGNTLIANGILYLADEYGAFYEELYKKIKVNRTDIASINIISKFISKNFSGKKILPVDKNSHSNDPFRIQRGFDVQNQFWNYNEIPMGNNSITRTSFYSSLSELLASIISKKATKDNQLSEKLISCTFKYNKNQDPPSFKNDMSLSGNEKKQTIQFVVDVINNIHKQHNTEMFLMLGDDINSLGGHAVGLIIPKSTTFGSPSAYFYDPNFGFFEIKGNSHANRQKTLRILLEAWIDLLKNCHNSFSVIGAIREKP